MRPLILLALVSCQPVADSLGDVGLCLWRDVGTVYEAPRDPQPDELCLRVTAPEHARVSAVELDPCDADALGHERVVVPMGEPVYRYSEPDVTPGAYAARWVVCP